MLRRGYIREPPAPHTHALRDPIACSAICRAAAYHTEEIKQGTAGGAHGVMPIHEPSRVPVRPTAVGDIDDLHVGPAEPARAAGLTGAVGMIDETRDR